MTSEQFPGDAPDERDPHTEPPHETAHDETPEGDPVGDESASQAPPPPPPPAGGIPQPAGPTPAGAIPTESRNWAMGAHLSAIASGVVLGGLVFVGPLVLWLIKKDEDAYVAHHAREALNFNLSVMIYSVGALILTIATLGIALLVVVPVGIAAAVAWLVVTIRAAVNASNGEGYRYPLTLRLIN